MVQILCGNNNYNYICHNCNICQNIYYSEDDSEDDSEDNDYSEMPDLINIDYNNELKPEEDEENYYYETFEIDL